MVEKERIIVDKYEDMAFDLHYPHYYSYSYIGTPVVVKYVEGRISKISPMDKELTKYIPEEVNPAIRKIKCMVVENRLVTGDFRVICYDVDVNSTLGVKYGFLESLRAFGNDKFCVGEIFGFLTDTLIKPTIVQVKEWEDFEARIDGIWHFGEEEKIYVLKERKLLDVVVDGLGVTLKYDPELDMLSPSLVIAGERVGGIWRKSIEVKSTDVVKGVTKGCKLLVDCHTSLLEIIEKGESEEIKCDCGNVLNKSHVVGRYFKCDNENCRQSCNSLISMYMGRTVDSQYFFKLLRLPNFKFEKRVKDTWSLSDQLAIKDFESYLRYLKQGTNLTKVQEKVIEVNALKLYNLLNDDD